MALIEILTYPDERLKQVATAVSEFDHSLTAIADDMIEIMQASPGGVGIAAPQLGYSKRIIVVNAPQKTDQSRQPDQTNHGMLVLVNPEISKWKGMVKAREGCLSVPDYTGKVIRAEKIALHAQDLNGKACSYSMQGYEARIVQHEIDHLEGILFIDRVISRRHDLFQRRPDCNNQ